MKQIWIIRYWQKLTFHLFLVIVEQSVTDKTPPMKQEKDDNVNNQNDDKDEGK